MLEKIKKSMTLRLTLFVFFCLLSSSLFTVCVAMLLVNLGVRFRTANFAIYLIIAFAFSCAVGTVIAMVVSKKMAQLYYRFKLAMNEIANGNFDIVLPPVGENKFYNQIIDDFNKMVKELKSVQILRSDFISTFSHELKTPIVSINGFSELLLDEKTTDEEKKEYAKIIYDESARLSSLAKNTLLLSKLEGQTMISDKRVFSLDEQIEECVILFEKQIKQKKIEVITSLSRVSYFWDSNLLSQLFTNLISNAVKFSPEGGKIEIALTRKLGYVTVSVKDEGPGINKTEAEKIFDRYYQSESEHKSEGSGLGLAIVKKITTLCGGKIEVEGEKGKGSIFTVVLPERLPE